MNKIGSWIDQLHHAEVALAGDFRAVGQRHPKEPDLWYGCAALARQCDERAGELRQIGEGHGAKLADPHDSELLASLMGHVRRAGGEIIGRRSSSGLLMLRDLRHLYTAAEEIDFYWIGLGQIAQAKRDENLIGAVDRLHRQVLTQVKWIKTRLKESSPQILVGR